jgi:agmatinase
MTFDPNAAAGAKSGIFGLPYEPMRSALVLLPVGWEVTTSYSTGTAKGPRAIYDASKQIDLYDADVVRPYEPGIAWLGENRDIDTLNFQTRTRAEPVIRSGGPGDDVHLRMLTAEVNEKSEELNAHVRKQTQFWLVRDKIVGVVGGDHSVPLGAIQAIAEKHPELGVLHFDAHLDLRDAYEGFTYSHASILRNVLETVPQVKRLVQVGIRDYCEEEVEYARAQGDRVRISFWRDLAVRRFEGATWGALCREIIEPLPQDVWITFDIDGLDPRFCPHTGTPVPGGLDFDEANYLIAQVVRSGRRIVGFDLNEVAPDPSGYTEWDANVGARMLYKLCAWTLASQGLAKLQP